jgi:hypothetical protein
MAHYWWDEFWRGRWWPLGWFGPYRPFWVTYLRSETSDILHIRLDRKVRKEDVKVRLVEPETIEIEVKRRPLGEEIPVE